MPRLEVSEPLNVGLPASSIAQPTLRPWSACATAAVGAARAGATASMGNDLTTGSKLLARGNPLTPITPIRFSQLAGAFASPAPASHAVGAPRLELITRWRTRARTPFVTEDASR